VGVIGIVLILIYSLYRKKINCERGSTTFFEFKYTISPFSDFCVQNLTFVQVKKNLTLVYG
jgi:hypothetical protein